MKILKDNAGHLTNFEVYDFLRKQGASTDPTQRVMTRLTHSELKVFDYLAGTPACSQTKESILEFFEKSKAFKLAKAEIVNIINIRPGPLADEGDMAVEIAPLIEEFDKRMDDDGLNELQRMVDEVLPVNPNRQLSNEEAGDEEIGEDQMDAS